MLNFLERILHLGDMFFSLRVKRKANTSDCVSGKACVQLHQGKWQGRRYHWYLGEGDKLRGFSTVRIPSLGETVTAFALPDKPATFLRFVGHVDDSELAAGTISLVEIATADIIRDCCQIRFSFHGNVIRGTFMVVREVGDKYQFTRIS